jgi:flagellar biosynthetic protein FliR
MNNQSNAVGIFFSQMASLLFVVMNGHLMVLMAVNRSFQAFPIDQNFLQALAQMKLHQLGGELFASALWIALPMIGLLMFTNLALGIMSRVAPQLNIFAIGFPITLLVGLVGVAFALPMLDQPFIALMGRIIDIFG